MPWIESASSQFRARHDTRDTDEAVRVLTLLERTSARLVDYFPQPAGELTVVLHRRAAELVLAGLRSPCPGGGRTRQPAATLPGA